MYQYKAHINRKVSSCSFHYAEIFGPNQNILVKICVAAQWKSTIFFLGGGGGEGCDLPYFALKCDNFPKWLRKKAESPNEAYFLAKKI